MAIVAVAGSFLTLWRLTTLGGIDPIGAMLVLTAIGMLAPLPAWRASPNRWLLGASWAMALWPLTVPGSCVIGFEIARAALTRPPTYIDHTPLDDTFREIPFGCIIATMVTIGVGCGLPLLAPNPPAAEPRRWNPQLVPVFLTGPICFLAHRLVLWNRFQTLAWLTD